MNSKTPSQIRQEIAEEQFPLAEQVARQSGMLLIKRSSAFYQLRHRELGWKLNLFPGSQQIYRPDKNSTCPRLLLYNIWSLLDVILKLKNHYERN